MIYAQIILGLLGIVWLISLVYKVFKRKTIDWWDGALVGFILPFFIFQYTAGSLDNQVRFLIISVICLTILGGIVAGLIKKLLNKNNKSRTQ